MADNSVSTGKIYELRNSANNRWMYASASQTRGSSSENFSTINWSLTVGGSATYWCDTGPTTLWVGSERVYYLGRVSWSYAAFPVVPGTVGSSFKVYHNTDGSVSNLTVSLTSAINTGEANADTVTATLTMSSIARYFSSTPTITSSETTETSIKYNWKTSETCSQIVVKYKAASASSYTTYSTTSVSATSGSFTISGLSPGTKYNVYITAKRSDSGLTTDSAVSSPTTYNWPYIKSISTSQLTIGGTQTLTIYNPRGHTLAIYMKQDSTSSDTVLFSQTGITTIVGDSETYDITPNEDTLYASIPSLQVGNAVYYCTSSGGGMTSYKSGTYKITGSEKPSMPSSMFTFSEGNSVVSSIKPGDFVQLLSIVNGLVTDYPTGNNSAEIISCTATLGGVTYDITGKNQVITWSNLNISGEQNVYITATDSRGLSNSTSFWITYLPYTYPSISATAARVNNYGENVTLSVTYTVSTVNSTNQASVYYSGASNSGYMLGSASGLGSIDTSGRGTLTTSLAKIDNDSSYTFNFTLTDRYGQKATASASLSRGMPIMFVDSEVLGVGVNKFPSFNGLDVNGPIMTDRYAWVGQSEGGATDTYYKFASLTTAYLYNDYNITFKVYAGYNDNSTAVGILTAHFRTTSTGTFSSGELVWEYAGSGIVLSNFKLGYVDGDAKTTVELWANVPNAWQQFKFVVLTEGQRTAQKPLWTLYHDVASAGAAAPTDGLTLKDSTLLTLQNTSIPSTTTLLSKIYPVGSIYMSVVDTSPSSFIGGTWTRLSDRFLLGYGTTYSTGGATGGASTVTLTTTQIPSHTHTIPALSGTAASAGSHYHKVTAKTTSYASGTQSSWRCLSFSDTSADYSQDVYTGGRTSTSNAESAGAHTHSVTTTSKASESTGGGSSHNNMPPYLVVYMWKRTA